MKLLWVSLIGVLLLTTVLSSSAVELDQNPENENVPIKFWRANPQEFPILDSHVFPMAVLDPSGSFENLGKAWITWEIEVQNKKLGVFAIYNRGRLQNFTVLDSLFDDIKWYGVSEQLLIVGILEETSAFYYYSLSDEPFSFTQDGFYTNHQLFFSPIEAYLYVYDLEEELSRFFLPTSFGIQTFGSREKVTTTAPGMALVEKPSGDRIIYTSTTANITLPQDLGENLNLGHVLLNPAVIDFSSQELWNEQVGYLPLPEDSEEVFFFGQASSIIRTSNNSLWEWENQEWSNIGTIDLPFDDFAVIDTSLYIGPLVNNGISLVTTGLDEDGDGIPSTMEDYFGSLSTQDDTDGDGISDFLEIALGTNPNLNDREMDIDGDRLPNGKEFELGLDPKNPDTDFGGALDGWEISHEYDPFSPEDDMLDPDNDGVTNAKESLWNTDPRSGDTDGDQIPDGWEILYQLDPLDSRDADEDPDNDGRSNLEEFRDQTDPFLSNRRAIFEGMWMVIPLIVGILLVPTYITYKRVIFD